MTETALEPRASDRRDGRLPLPALIALALSGFVTILTEALPAGLLPQIAADLSVSQSGAGQTVTVYALGSLIAAIPLTRATQGVRRRPLLAATMLGFAIANLVTAVSASYLLTLIARWIAGISAGLLWALLAGYAARLVPDHQKGRAIAVAMAGTPLALSIGVPAATYLGSIIGWRTCFALMSAAAILLSVWVSSKLPDIPSQSAGSRVSLTSIMAVPGILPILFVTLTFVLAHNVLYTYIAPLLQRAAMERQVDSVLFLFGCSSLVGIWAVGVLVDRKLQLLAIISCLLFIASGVVLACWLDLRPGVYFAVLLWGGSFGGAATIFQTAMARTAGEHVDIGQSMLVTAWNLAIAGGGVLGGLVLAHWSVDGFIPAVLALSLTSLLTVVLSGRRSFRDC